MILIFRQLFRLEIIIYIIVFIFIIEIYNFIEVLISFFMLIIAVFGYNISNINFG